MKALTLQWRPLSLCLALSLALVASVSAEDASVLGFFARSASSSLEAVDAAATASEAEDTKVAKAIAVLEELAPAASGSTAPAGPRPAPRSATASANARQAADVAAVKASGAGPEAQAAAERIARMQAGAATPRATPGGALDQLRGLSSSPPVDSPETIHEGGIQGVDTAPHRNPALTPLQIKDDPYFEGSPNSPGPDMGDVVLPTAPGAGSGPAALATFIADATEAQAKLSRRLQRVRAQALQIAGQMTALKGAATVDRPDYRQLLQGIDEDLRTANRDYEAASTSEREATAEAAKLQRQKQAILDRLAAFNRDWKVLVNMPNCTQAAVDAFVVRYPGTTYLVHTRTEQTKEETITYTSWELTKAEGKSEEEWQTALDILDRNRQAQLEMADDAQTAKRRHTARRDALTKRRAELEAARLRDEKADQQLTEKWRSLSTKASALKVEADTLLIDYIALKRSLEDARARQGKR